MTHLDDATVVAARDGEVLEPALVAHLRACLPCRERLSQARARSDAIADLISAVPGAADRASAKARVRRRLDADRFRYERVVPRIMPRSMRRAAAILLVSAGTVYAVPRIPLSDWLGGPEATGSSSSTRVPAPGAVTPDAPTPQEAVLVAAGERLEVRVEGVSPEGQVELLWLDRPNAWIAAGPGATYAVGEATATVRVRDAPVRIGAPRETPLVVIRINGEVVFEGDGRGDARDRILFSAPGA